MPNHIIGSGDDAPDSGLGGTQWAARTSLVSAVGALAASGWCCVLPTVLQGAGLGGAIASVVSAIPGVTFLSAHKAWVFLSAGLLLALSWATMTGRLPVRWSRALGCPISGAPVPRVWRISTVLYLASLAIAYSVPVARFIRELL